MKVLITIASEQVWPQIVPVYHLINKDKTIFDKIIILYSGFNPSKSKDPATRLKTFIEKYDLSKETYLQEVEGEMDFSEPLNNLVNNLGITTSDDVYVNFTGGTKTMSLMLSIWAAQKGYTLFYTYSGSRLQFYKQISNGILNKVRSEDIDVRITNDIDPIDIVKLQCGEEFICDEGNTYDSWSKINEIPVDSYTDGKKLEQEMLFYFFDKKNIKFRHSVELKSRESTIPHEEIDILLNYNGSLWIIECKMKKYKKEWRHSIHDRISNAYNNTKPHSPEKIENLIHDIENNLSDNAFMQFKADIFSAKKISGLNAKIMWITTNEFSNKKIEDFLKDEGVAHLQVSVSQNKILTPESKKELDNMFK